MKHYDGDEGLSHHMNIATFMDTVKLNNADQTKILKNKSHINFYFFLTQR